MDLGNSVRDLPLARQSGRVPRWRKRAVESIEATAGSDAASSAYSAGEWPPVDLDHLQHWIVMVAPRSSRLLEAIEVASGLVESASPKSLFRIDYQVRRLDAWDSSGWNSWRPEDLSAVVETSGRPVAVGALMSMHGNGWLREASVRLLSQQQTGEELRWLLLRCVDWVPQVRAAAQAAVRARLANPTKTYIDRFVSNTALLISIRFRSLQGDTELPRDIAALLRGKGAISSLRAASREGDTASRRAAVEMLIGQEPPLDLLRSQLELGDIVAISRAASSALSGDNAEDAARLLLASPFASLRATALWTLLGITPTDASLVERGLGDASRLVRDIAQRHAPSSGVEPLAWYRERLADDPLVALRGLGDVGDQKDADRAAEFLASTRASVRGAAARVLGRKGGPSHTDTLMQLVLAADGQCARESTRGLIQRGITRRLADDLAAEAIARHAPAATRRLYFQLLPHTDRWVALRLGLVALTNPDSDIAAAGLHLVSVVWLNWNRSATSPSDQLPAINDLVQRARPLLRKENPRLADQLEFLMKTTG